MYSIRDSKLGLGLGTSKSSQTQEVHLQITDPFRVSLCLTAYLLLTISLVLKFNTFCVEQQKKKNLTMSQKPSHDDMMAKADRDMEERAERAKAILNSRYTGIRRNQVRILVVDHHSLTF